MDEGIRDKFFSDLGSLLQQNPEFDDLIQGFENVGLNEKQTDTSIEDVEDLSSDGDFSTSNRNMQHRIRPDAEDCLFFIRTGTCKFGQTCKFNHPVSRKIHVDRGKNKKNVAESSSKNSSQIPCKLYSTGYCKYGDSCRFNHSKSEPESSELQLNILGLPERLGKENCSFYMRTGICGYGISCIFNHPKPIFYTYEYMDTYYQEALETYYAPYPYVPHGSQSTERELKFGGFPSDINGDGDLKKNENSSTNGPTSESPSGGYIKCVAIYVCYEGILRICRFDVVFVKLEL